MIRNTQLQREIFKHQKFGRLNALGSHDMLK